MSDQNTSSGVNTVLIVIVLLILVAFGVWWFTIRGGAGTPAPANSPGVNVDVTLPTGSGQQGGPAE
jgi:hypothetical protein